MVVHGSLECDRSGTAVLCPTVDSLLQYSSDLRKISIYPEYYAQDRNVVCLEMKQKVLQAPIMHLKALLGQARTTWVFLVAFWV